MSNTTKLEVGCRVWYADRQAIITKIEGERLRLVLEHGSSVWTTAADPQLRAGAGE